MEPLVELLAAQFTKTTDDVRAFVEDLPDNRWDATCEAEGWTVAAVARHIAAGIAPETELVEAVANGNPFHPAYHDWELIHLANSGNTELVASRSKGEVLELLEVNRERALEMLGRLSDAQLDRTALVPVISAQPVSAAELIELVLVGHITGHLGSIEAALRV